MGHPQDFPFGIMDVAELLHLRIRRRQADSVYVDCPFCGDQRGKMNINFAKNVWRCNYCDEHGGMIALYAKAYHISNFDAYREICEALQTGLPAPEYTVGDFQHKEKQEVPQAELASIQEIHQTLSVLLGMLTLSKKHREHLQTKRGLTDEQIGRLGYKSTPPFYLCRTLAEKLIRQHCTVQGVPGFYMNDDGKWTINFNSVTAGIIIPARGMDGMLRGAQIRLDVPIKNKDDPPEKEGTKYLWLSSASKTMGVSSGSPVHFVGDPFARVIYVIEGLLKADITHCLTGRSFLATAGANNVSKLEPIFTILAQNGTEMIVEAEDMDKYRNKMVNKGASRIYLMARQHGLKCRRLTWNPNYKGMDDWQLALKRKQTAKEGCRMNFKDRFICGLCSFDGISDEIEAWHEAPENGVGLTEYLGMTEEEYGCFIRNGEETLTKLLLAQRVEQRFRIYQLDFSDNAGTKAFAFSGIEALHKAGYEQPPAAEYCLVHDGKLLCCGAFDDRRRLQLIAERYSDKLPENYAGRSVSPSDIIELHDEDGRRYFYCDGGGDFCQVRFSPMLAKPVKRK